MLSLLLAARLTGLWRWLPLLFCLLLLLTTISSLSVSHWVYDRSGIYSMDWLKPDTLHAGAVMVNINAGFDETSLILQSLVPGVQLVVLDFYDPALHTEISIKRARKRYPRYPGTIPINTASVPMRNHSADHILLMFAAHEIRNKNERIAFFRELKRVLKINGTITVVEHLRDRANFLAYAIGFFHFHSRASWIDTFSPAGLEITAERKLTPFVSIFTIRPHGSAY